MSSLLHHVHRTAACADGVMYRADGAVSRRWLRTALSILLIAPAWSATAQDAPDALVGRGAYATVSMSGVYQHWDTGETDFEQVSFPLHVNVRLNRAASIGLSVSQASASGSDVETLDGVTDPQITFNLVQNVGRSSLLFATGINIPGGKKKLTPEEFATAIVLTEDFLRFGVPSFGRGLNVSPSLTLAMPLGNSLVVGVGGMYQYRGRYRPLQELDDDYDPGDEFLVTGGFDVKLTRSAHASADITYTVYNTDKLGDVEVFGSGNKLVATAQLRNYFGHHDLWLYGRYRTRAKNELAVGGVLVDEISSTNPDQVELFGHVRIRLNATMHVRLMAEGRHFASTALVSDRGLFGGGVGLEVTLSPSVTVPLRAKYFTGEFDGVEAVAGLLLRF